MAITYRSTFAAILLLAMASAAVGEDDPIKARQAVMKATGAAVGTLVKMTKGETPFDAAAAKDALETIATKPKGFDALFPAGSDKGDTAAKPAIWTDNAGFKAALEKLLATAGAEAAKPPADLNGVKAAIKAIGEACGNCHETYRVKKS